MRAAKILAALTIVELVLAPALAADGAVKLNQIQRVGTGESYKLAPSQTMLRLIRMGGKKDALKLDFGEPSLATQLDNGAGSLSFDIAYDPKGGLFKSPAGAAMADEVLGKDYQNAMAQPGFKVIHVLDVDYKSQCLTLKACLGQVANWSRAHPGHLPLVIVLTPDDQKTPMPGATRPLAFDGAALAALDREIEAVFRPGEIITPQLVKGDHANLGQAIAAGGWPVLASARGKLLFVFEDGGAKTAPYQGRLLFVTGDEKSPNAGFIAIDDPLKQGARIKADVRTGFMVITRADTDTLEARANDTRRRDAAFASGAQIVESDFLLPDAKIGPYRVMLKDGVRCDTVSADCSRAVMRTARR